MDRVAHELKLDRAEVRRRNFIKPSQMPYKVGIIFRDGRPVTFTASATGSLTEGPAPSGVMENAAIIATW